MKRWILKYILIITACVLWLLPAIILIQKHANEIQELQNDPNPIFYIRPIWFLWSVPFWPALLFTVVLLLTLVCWYLMKSRLAAGSVSLGICYLLLIAFFFGMLPSDPEGFGVVTLTTLGFIAVHPVVLFIVLVLRSADKHKYIVYKQYYLLLALGMAAIVSTGSVGAALLSESHLKQVWTELYDASQLRLRDN